jgi:peptidylprolyl isomerase
MFMQKTIIALVLMLVVSAGAAFGQRRTTRHPIRPTARKTKTMDSTASSANKMNAVTTASGLTYVVTQHGTGAQLKAGDNIIIHYTGLLTNGQKFDSSVDRNEPFSFPLGAGRVIKGWDEGIAKLRVGDRATLFIPPTLGYGAAGAGGVIPPNATLIFVVEVIGVK